MNCSNPYRATLLILLSWAVVFPTRSVALDEIAPILDRVIVWSPTWGYFCAEGPDRDSAGEACGAALTGDAGAGFYREWTYLGNDDYQWIVEFHYFVETTDPQGNVSTSYIDRYGEEYWICPSSGYTYDAGTHTCRRTEPDYAKNKGCPEPPGRSAQPVPPAPTAGNPINIASGNKCQVETDYRSGGPAPLELTRYYNSHLTGTQETAVGAHWRTNFDRSIVVTESSTLTTVSAYRADGQVLHFDLASSGSLSSDPDVLEELARLEDANGDLVGWELTTPDHSVESYDADGKLVSITDRRGYSWSLHYDTSSRLETVSAPHGRSLSFVYGSDGLLDQVSAPGGLVYGYSHDAGTNLVTVTNPDSSQREYRYAEPAHSASGRPHDLTGIIDENGDRFATFRYNQYGGAISTEHGVGAGRWEIAYPASDRRTVTSPLGRTRTLRFSDVHGSLRHTSTSGVRLRGGSLAAAASYDANGFLSETVDFNGVVTRYTYSVDGNELSRQVAFGTPNARTTATTWHPALDLPTEISEPGRSTQLAYDSQGNLLSRAITDTASAETRTTSYTYTNELLTGIDGPRTDVADVWTLGYDSSGNLSSIENPLGHLTSIPDYDVHGRPLRIVDPNGVETLITRDYRGRVLTTDTANAKWTYVYDLAGNLVSVTDPIGAQTTLAYDAARRLVEVTDALSNRVEFTLDAAGNRTLERYFDASGVLRTRRERVFAPEGWLAEVKGNGGQSTLYARDDEGHVVRETVAGQFVTDFVVDEFGRVIETTDAEQGVSEHGYDALGRMIRFADPRGVVTEYLYNAFDEVVEEQSPDRGTWGYTYDSAGNLTSEVDARGVLAAHSYDALDRRTTTDFSDPVGGPAFQRDMRKYFYDQGTAQIGRLTRLESHGTLYLYGYDVWGNLVSEFSRIYRGGDTDEATVGYRYDLAGNLEGILHDDGTDVEYTLDALGRPITIDVQRGAVSTQLASSIEYLPFGPIRDLVLGNGITVQRDFDLDGRLVAQTDGSVRDVGYAHDTRNNVTDLLDLLDTTRSESYSYDRLSRLVAASRGGSDWQYSYDPAGNRTVKMASVEIQGPVQANVATAEIYEYALDSNRLETVAGTRVQSISYDENGNTVEDGTQAVEFDVANRAVSFGPSLLDLTTLTRQYNALGQRVAETRLPETPLEVKTYYRYDPQGNLLAERIAGVQTRTYVHLEGRPLATWSIPSDPVTEDDLGEPALYYYHTDHLGTPRKMTDASGAIAWDADYAPFGEASIRTEEVVNHLRFPGQYDSPETGLHYNYFRDYDSKSGRFIESDSVGLLGGPNTYGYAYSNPTNLIDPDGRFVLALVLAPPAKIVAGTLAAATVVALGSAIVGTYDLISGRPVAPTSPISGQVCQQENGEEGAQEGRGADGQTDAQKDADQEADIEAEQADRRKVGKGEEIQDISKSRQRARARRDRIRTLEDALEDFGDD